MKNKILSALILTVVMVGTTFANNIDDKNVNQRVLETFSQKFSNATNVKWIASQDYIKAVFQWNDQTMFGYFAETGELIGVSRNLLSTQLPIGLQRELQSELGKSWITQLYEFSTENETLYFVTIENADQRVILKSNGSNSWETYKKTKKS